jgi:pimeloyl-ACP methyl ester carboxylesterase
LHKPSPDRPRAANGRPPAAIVMVNSMTATRAGNGDGAVFLADSLAEMGYPFFRLDLPGYGDSIANPPAGLLDFTNSGGFGPPAAQAIAELAARYGFPKIVILGHCAGAVNAVFAAAEMRNCAGLIVLGPYFHLPSPPRAEAREKLSSWALRSPVGRFLCSAIYDPLKEVRLRLSANRVPENANGPLLRHWQSITTAGMPVLSIVGPARKAAGKQTRIGEFDYMAYAVKLAGSRGRVEVQFAQGADHSFANHQGRAEVRRHIVSWMQAHFPLAGEARGSAAPHSAEGVAARVEDLRYA